MEKHTTTAKSKITRRNYSRISGSLELPNLVEIQTNSYKWFKEVGIKEVFDDIYPITNFNETLSLEFVDCAFDEPKYSVNESKDRDANYAAPIRATLRLINSGTGEIKEQEVFMGDFPLMTDSGTFIINGAERVIVSQLVRSPGAYFADAIDKSGKTVFEGSIIPSRGTWLEFENDAKDVLNALIKLLKKANVQIKTNAKVEKIISVKRKNWVTKEYDERNCKIDSLETIECWSDISSMEIFVNQGSKVFSMRMFTEEENGKVKISGLMKETVVEMYDLMGEGEEKNE